MDKELLYLYHGALCHANRLGYLIMSSYPVNSEKWNAYAKQCEAVHRVILTVDKWIDEEKEATTIAATVTA